MVACAVDWSCFPLPQLLLLPHLFLLRFHPFPCVHHITHEFTGIMGQVVDNPSQACLDDLAFKEHVLVELHNTCDNAIFELELDEAIAAHPTILPTNSLTSKTSCFQHRRCPVGTLINAAGLTVIFTRLYCYVSDP